MVGDSLVVTIKVINFNQNFTLRLKDRNIKVLTCKKDRPGIRNGLLDIIVIGCM